MPSSTRRVVTGAALALPLALSPAALAIAPVSAAPTRSVTAAPAGDPVPTPTTKRTPLRWSQYVAQKPTWSAKLCTPDIAAGLKDIPKKQRPVIECARIRTPLDWGDLSKGSMVLQLTRTVRPKAVRRAVRAPRARGLFVNPGGPGGPAGLLVAPVALTKPMLRTTHDIVAVDPRGTGGSTPLPCRPYMDPIPDLRVTTRAARAKVQAAYRTFAQTCVAEHRSVLRHITTANTVHDHDLARRVLGYPQADWFGISGGSWMGAYYARLHPRTVGRVVVDANTDFSSDWRTSFHDFPMGFQRRYDRQFLPWAARHHREYKLGTTAAAVRASVERVRAAAGAGKVPGLTPNTLDLVVFQLLYADETLPALATQIGKTATALRTGRRPTAFRMPEGMNPVPGGSVAAPAVPKMALVTVRQSIICNDGPFTRTPASFEKEILDLGRRFPNFGYISGMIVAPCAYWKVPVDKKVQIAGVPMPRMLMLQNQLDPATPIEGAKRAHAAVRNTRMITVKGAGAHGAFLAAPPTSCVAKHTMAYLQQGVFPTRDLECTGTPLPGDTKVYEYTTG